MILKISKMIPLLIAFITGLFFLLHNHMISQFAFKGILLWGKLLVPVLLPYIILSKIWLSYGIIDDIRKIFYKIFRGNGTLSNALPIMVIGLICGYPTGAIFVKAGYENRILSREQADILLPLCSFVSPMFLAGYVCPLLNLSIKKWTFMLLSLYLSPFIIFIYNLIHNHSFRENHSKTFKTQENSKECFTNILESSLHIIFMIGLYIMIFSILFGFAQEHSMNNLPFLFILSNLEVTSGVSLLAHITSLHPLLQSILVTFTLSIGGLCCYGQIHSIVYGCGFNMKKYFTTKIKQASISIIILTCLWILL